MIYLIVSIVETVPCMKWCKKQLAAQPKQGQKILTTSSVAAQAGQGAVPVKRIPPSPIHKGLQSECQAGWYGSDPVATKMFLANRSCCLPSAEITETLRSGPNMQPTPQRFHRVGLLRAQLNHRCYPWPIFPTGNKNCDFSRCMLL